MRSPVFRLLPYIQQNALRFWAGILGLFCARIFESLISLLIKTGIDGIAEGKDQTAAGRIDYDAAMDVLVFPVVAIFFCVLAQMAITIFSRIMIRKIGMEAAYDLRNRIYQH